MRALQQFVRSGGAVQQLLRSQKLLSSL